jgi:nucleoid DNA-binding protein
LPGLLNFHIFAFVALEKHIASLLYRYQCVVVPGFGAFLSQIKPATLQRDSNTFHPPGKTLSFNAQLRTNDGLLVSHVARASGKSFEEALEEVNARCTSWKQHLEAEGKLELTGLGVLRMNSEKKMVFQPDSEVNYLMDAFGLGPVMASPVLREVLKEEVRELEAHIPFNITPETRAIPGLRPLMKYAAIALLALATGIGGYSYYQQQANASQLARQEAQEAVSKTIQEATFFSVEPLELPSVTLEVTQKQQGIHHIVAGAFRFRENAEKKIGELRSKGYPARYLGANAYGLHQVVYASYSDPQEALDSLRAIRGKESPDAWLLSQR